MKDAVYLFNRQSSVFKRSFGSKLKIGMPDLHGQQVRKVIAALVELQAHHHIQFPEKLVKIVC
jgi:hypothetical protein